MKVILLILALLAVLGIGYRLWHENPTNGLLEPHRGTLLMVSGNTLSAISSPLPKYQTELWEISQQYNYDFDILYDLWYCEDRSLTHDGIWGDNYQSYGGFQWQFKSWVMYNRILETKLNILLFKDQAILTTLVLQKGEWGNWFNCLEEIYLVQTI